MKIAIVADSNSGITQAEAKELGMTVIPTPAIINGKTFLEDINLTQEGFYEKLKDDSVSVSSSQPSSYDTAETWRKLLKENDELIYIPISSGLSETVHSAQHLAEDPEFAGKVFVIDDKRVSITQKCAALDALELAKQGKTGKEIADWLMETSMQSSIYITVDTLKYLKNGGRLTPAVAAIGTLLKIKPVLQIQGDKLDQYAKTRKMHEAKKIMLDAVKKDLETRFKPHYDAGKMKIFIAHTENYAEAEIFKKEAEEYLGLPIEYIDPLSLSVSVHIGPGALAIACAVSVR
ncbi:MAG: DegV family protein [Clostridia bacterium]|nr:DegV family protein [Clostridia bacterium]